MRNGLDFEALSQRFNDWAIEHVPIQPKQWVGVDGKRSKRTLTGAFEQKQNFVALVSLLRHKLGLVHGSKLMENKHNSAAQSGAQAASKTRGASIHRRFKLSAALEDE